MNVENRDGIGGILGDLRGVGNIVRKLLVPYAADLTKKCIPGITLGVEEDQRIAEQARKNLDSAYGLLGGETGEVVSWKQIVRVLKAEQKILTSPWARDSQIGWFERYPLLQYTIDGDKSIREEMYFGVFYLMRNRIGEYTSKLELLEQEGKDPNSESAKELERRARACYSANSLLLSKPL